MAKQGPERRQRRNGRGQLSSIDLLPEDADDAIAWANAQLRERNVPQGEILREFNDKLASLGIGPISRSAFSRHSVRLAIELRKLRASRDITNILLDRVSPDERDDMMLAAVEIVKAQLLRVFLEDDPDPKSLAHATLALSRLSATQQREAEGKRRNDRFRRQEDEREEALRREREMAEARAKTVEQVISEAGLSAERIDAIRRGVLGLNLPPKPQNKS